jgi:hypothetical protein
VLDVLPVTFADGRLMAAMDDLTVLGYAAASTFRGVVEALHPEPDRERAALLASMARVLGGDTTTVVRPLSLDEMGSWRAEDRVRHPEPHLDGPAPGLAAESVGLVVV